MPYNRRLPPRRRRPRAPANPRRKPAAPRRSNYRTPGARGNRSLAVIPRPVVKKGPSGAKQLMNQVFENKIVGSGSPTEVPFVFAAPTTDPCIVSSFNFGTPNPSAWNTLGWTSLGPNVPQSQGATGINEYTGNYIYMKHSTIKMSLDMNTVLASAPNRTGPVQFRIIAYTAKRENSPQGITNDPSTSLFIDQTGSAVGWNTTTAQQNELFLYSLNFRNFNIISDIVTEPFSSPQRIDTTATDGYTNPPGPCALTKGFKFVFPHEKKVKLVSTGGAPPTLVYPSDANTTCYVTVIGRHIGSDALININGQEIGAVFGSTCYLDN